jgi:hypothetical protein
LAAGGTINNRETQFYGLIDDVAVFNRALTPPEIQTLVNTSRLSGSETGLQAGWTFDATTPAGGALPANLSRPATFGKLTSTVFGAREPSQKTLVSMDRDSAFDSSNFLPPPIQQTQMQLPFPAGEAWEVIQGWDNAGGSHKGAASFAWDFKLAGRPQVDTNGKPYHAAGGGTVIEMRDDRGSCSGYPANYVMVQQASDEIGAYLHSVMNSTKVALNATVTAGDGLANTGDTGNTGCGAFHLHFALHNQTESHAATLVTLPGAYSDYEVSTDQGITWKKVDYGVPLNGEWIRR